MRRGIAVLALLGLTACAAPGARLDPASLPLRVRDQIFTLDYRVDREPTRIAAVGLVNSSAQMFRFVRLHLLGLAADGRVVSQGITTVDGTFGLPVQFAVDLRPTGTEVRFELQVGDYALGFGGR